MIVSKISGSQKNCGVSSYQIGFSFHKHPECKLVEPQAGCEDLYEVEPGDVQKEVVGLTNQVLSRLEWWSCLAL